MVWSRPHTKERPCEQLIAYGTSLLAKTTKGERAKSYTRSDRNFCVSNLTRSFLPLIIVIVASGFLVPVQAFSPAQTSSISGLSYPSNVVVGAPLVVSFNVAYSVGSYSSLWLITAIGCGPNEPNCSFVSPQGVSSTPVSCNSANPFGNQYPLMSQTCYLTVSSSSSEVFSYSFSFNQVGTYYLTALSQLNVPYNSYDIQGSYSVSQTMVITVNAPSAQGGNVIYGGTLSGLPPDGTISQVSFSLEGGNLVTVFQVQGQISTTYAYTIGISDSPNCWGVTWSPTITL